LSGGEKARLLMARLLLEGCNLLLLDEPTNDLDLETLRVLEDAMLAFDGAMVVVTHDRAFLDRVCNRILSFEEGGLVDYADRLQMLAAEKKRTAERVAKPSGNKKVSKSRVASVALSFKEKQELQAFPALIESLEGQKTELESVLADSATYRDRAGKVNEITRQVEKVDREISVAYERWEQLMARAGG